MAKKELLWYIKLVLNHQSAFDKATDTQAKAALMLAFYCIRTAPNGGKVENARELLADKDFCRAYGFKAANRKALLKKTILHGLWHWEDSTLVSDIYPADVEEELLAKSRGGTESAKKRKAAKKTQETDNYSPSVHLNEY